MHRVALTVALLCLPLGCPTESSGTSYTGTYNGEFRQDSDDPNAMVVTDVRDVGVTQQDNGDLTVRAFAHCDVNYRRRSQETDSSPAVFEASPGLCVVESARFSITSGTLTVRASGKLIFEMDAEYSIVADGGVSYFANVAMNFTGDKR